MATESRRLKKRSSVRRILAQLSTIIREYPATATLPTPGRVITASGYMNRVLRRRSPRIVGRKDLNWFTVAAQ
jgi:hypothetical protein